jgi:hypothetical protein
MGWLKVDKPTGTGDGTIFVSCESNQGPGRTGRVRVYGGGKERFVEVDQEGTAMEYLYRQVGNGSFVYSNSVYVINSLHSNGTYLVTGLDDAYIQVQNSSATPVNWTDMSITLGFGSIQIPGTICIVPFGYGSGKQWLRFTYETGSLFRCYLHDVYGDMPIVYSVNVSTLPSFFDLRVGHMADITIVLVNGSIVYSTDTIPTGYLSDEASWYVGGGAVMDQEFESAYGVLITEARLV